MIRNVRSDHDGTRSTQFSASAALAVAVCALCSGLNFMAHTPITPMISVAAAGGAVCAGSLRNRSGMPSYHWMPRFAGSMVGVALSVAAAMISQAQHLMPGTELPAPFSAVSGKLAEGSSANPGPIRPLPLRDHPLSFLSHTHEPPVITFGKSP